MPVAPVIAPSAPDENLQNRFDRFDRRAEQFYVYLKLIASCYY